MRPEKGCRGDWPGAPAPPRGARGEGSKKVTGPGWEEGQDPEDSAAFRRSSALHQAGQFSQVPEWNPSSPRIVPTLMPWEDLEWIGNRWVRITKQGRFQLWDPTQRVSELEGNRTTDCYRRWNFKCSGPLDSQKDSRIGYKMGINRKLWKWKLLGLSGFRASRFSWTAAHQAPLCMGFFQTRKQEWVAIPFSRGSFPPKDWT